MNSPARSLATLIRFWPLVVTLIAVVGSSAVLLYRVGELEATSRAYAPRELVEIKFGAVLDRLNAIDQRLERIENRMK